MNDILGKFVEKPCWWKPSPANKSIKAPIPKVLRENKYGCIEKEIRKLPTIEDQLREWGIC